MSHKRCISACVWGEDLGERTCMQWHMVVIQLPCVHVAMLCTPSATVLSVPSVCVCVCGGRCALC